MVGLLIHLGLPFLLASIALVANVRVEKLMLGTLSTTISVEIFQIAWLAFIAGYAPILSIRAVMLSWFGEVRNQRDKLWHRAKRAAILIAVLSIPGFFLGGWIGMEALEIVFPDYAEQAVVVFFMAVVCMGPLPIGKCPSDPSFRSVSDRYDMRLFFGPVLSQI
ncbi:MAG: hypothetical protein Ct9H90mP16_20400 [Candidatus Poseidoniales archaeon]|nr:MAG: hypothetical protein Ct9H90mP16_20400 [Candidatus Poseidoniales archaeon]